MKIKHWQLFKDSLFQPKKLAAYRLLPIGKVIQYILMLVLFVTIVSLIQFVTGSSIETSQINGLKEFFNEVKWLIYPASFILLFLINSFSLFLQISIYALAGLVILIIRKKRGEYRHIWRTAALAVTLPTIIATLSVFLPIHTYTMTIFTALLTLLYVFIASSKYPNQPQK